MYVGGCWWLGCWLTHTPPDGPPHRLLASGLTAQWPSLGGPADHAAAALVTLTHDLAAATATGMHF